ncbi:MAG: glycosyl hydrolase family 18 protein [Lachnospiraceae bacterium]|nr:glycosyl hydrolase family 18 protein [Lachnospiraceae bacterium]MDD3617234.1 glycosyl hydrolase family 18 protein [Lachnospiraceae bacterium]
MNKKNTPVLVVIALIILVLIAGGISFIINRRTPGTKKADVESYFGLSSEEEAAVVVNHQVIDAKALSKDGTYFIDYDTVSGYINGRIYWDKNESKLIITTPSESVITDVSSGTTPDFYVDGDTGYVSMNLIEQYTTMECQVLESPNRIVIENSDETQITGADVTEDTQVREKGGIKSPILSEMTKGDTVTVLETMDNWSQVATEDGYTGYIQNDKLSEIYELTVPEDDRAAYTSLTRDHKINMVWHQVTALAANADIANIVNSMPGVNTISPTWFSITDNNGNISSFADAGYVQTAHAAGMEVWGLVDNFSTEISSLEILSHTTSRTNLINNLIQAAQAVDLDGINLDLELISEETGPHYVQFIREMGIACRKAGLVLSIDDPVPQPYTEHYNRKEQGIVADYVIIMGYDEHTSGSEEAGSVASLGFVEAGIENTVAVVPAEKVINGIPFYTRLWITDGSGNLSSEVYGMDGADKYVSENGLDVSWDAETGQNYAEKEDDTGLYQMWMENEDSITEKLKLVESYDLAGVSAWKLGFQRDSIWSVISQYVN